MRKFLSGLKDKLEGDSEKKHGRTSSKLNIQAGSDFAADDPANGLSNAMGAMDLGERPYAATDYSGGGFVGGFAQYPSRPEAKLSSSAPAFPSPSIPSGASYSYTPAPLPTPPRMAMPQPAPGQSSLTMKYALTPESTASPAQRPQSLTMQHALSSSTAYLELEAPPDIPHRPHSDEPRRHRLHHSDAGSVNHSSLGLDADTLSPPRPQKQRASSEPPPDSPSTAGKKRAVSSGAAVQCSGRTQKGTRCTRMVKSGGPALAQSNPDEEAERYCHQHLQAILTTSTGFYSRTTREWIKFLDWIPEYLDDETQAALRIDMEKSLSSDDKPGYIYTFEIRDPDSPLCHLKTGRTNTLNKRITEWRKQCGSKEVVLRGWWPGTVNGEDGAGTSLLDGRVVPGEPSAAATRTERLIHLELASLVMDAPYLLPGFPNIDKMKANEPMDDDDDDDDDESDSEEYKPAKTKKGKAKGSTPALKKLQRLNEPCKDCGVRHKEIFSFIRPQRGPLKNQEFEMIVKPVVEKWGLFTRTHLAP